MIMLLSKMIQDYQSTNIISIKNDRSESKNSRGNTSLDINLVSEINTQEDVHTRNALPNLKIQTDSKFKIQKFRPFKKKYAQKSWEVNASKHSSTRSFSKFSEKSQIKDQSDTKNLSSKDSIQLFPIIKEKIKNNNKQNIIKQNKSKRSQNPLNPNLNLK